MTFISEIIQNLDTQSLLYWIWLEHIPGIGNFTRRLLLNHFGTPQSIYLATKAELLTIPTIGPHKANQIISTKSLSSSKNILQKCQKENIHLLTMNHPIFPKQLISQKDFPTLLYYKGTLPAKLCGTAIVGSRRCSKQGKEMAISYATDCAKHAIPVISGMAKGIDSYAQTACIKTGGFPIAVLGNGLDICYPSEHKLLMKKIEETGLLLSEYEPGTAPKREFFPARNRIIAALSNPIFVAEAAKGSGALITANFGISYGKEVLYGNVPMEYQL